MMQEVNEVLNVFARVENHENGRKFCICGAGNAVGRYIVIVIVTRVRQSAIFIGCVFTSALKVKTIYKNLLQYPNVIVANYFVETNYRINSNDNNQG